MRRWSQVFAAGKIRFHCLYEFPVKFPRMLVARKFTPQSGQCTLAAKSEHKPNKRHEVTTGTSVACEFRWKQLIFAVVFFFSKSSFQIDFFVEKKKNYKQGPQHKNRRCLKKMVVNKPVFIENPSFSHDFLQQRSKRRVSHSKYGQTTITTVLTLPPHVQPHYWLKYKLSYSDILKQTEDIGAKFYWLSALVLGIDVCASAIKPSYSCRDYVIIMNKVTAIKKILKSQSLLLSAIDKIVHFQPQIVTPRAPIVRFNLEQLQQTENVCRNKNGEYVYYEPKPFSICVVKDVLRINDSIFLPIGFQDNHVLLKRAVLSEVFSLSGKQQASGYATRPFLFYIDHHPETVFALAEDIIWVNLAR